MGAFCCSTEEAPSPSRFLARSSLSFTGMHGASITHSSEQSLWDSLPRAAEESLSSVTRSLGGLKVCVYSLGRSSLLGALAKLSVRQS